MEEIAVLQVFASLPESPKADSDEQLLEIWLHGRSRHTQRAYRADVEHFLTWVRKPFLAVTLADLQGIRGLSRRTGAGESLPDAVSHQISPRFRPPDRVPALRCRPRTPSAGGPQPPRRAHLAGSRSTPYPEPGDESPEPGDPHAPLCLRHARERVVRPLLAGSPA